MSPVASNGTLHSRSTSVHVGAPIGTGNGAKPSSINTMVASSRVLPHLDDVKRVPDFDINRPIRTIIQDAELCAKQAETQIDFRRPDVALQEYMKACTLLVEIIPHHKDYPTLQTGTGELYRAYIGLRKRINAQRVKIDEAITMIKEDNMRSGVHPTSKAKSDDEILREQINGHVRAQSVQSPSNAGAQPYTINGYQDSTRSTAPPGIFVPIPASAGGSLARTKPPVHPKPDALHGKSLYTIDSTPAPSPPLTDLETRLARLRGPVASPMQDSRVQIRPISMSTSPQSSGHSPIVTKSSIIRPGGPREMPPAPTSVQRPTNMSIDVPVTSMPRPPDAIYSPERNTDSLAGLDLPTSVPRGSPYPGFNNQTSAPPISTVGPSPSSVNPRTEYFSSFDTPDAPGYSQNPSKREHFALPDVTTVTAEALQTYIRMESRGLKLLVVDLRSREEFDAGHININSIICVEPIVLRNGMSAEELGDSIVLAPDTEQKLYEKRCDFDLVVFYDRSSSSLKATDVTHESTHYLQDFARSVFDFGYSKRLKRRPMLLIGGLEAWVDVNGPGSLKASSTSPTLTRRMIKASRPIGRVPMARDSPKLQALARRPRESRPLSKEEEKKWVETLRADTEVNMADGENSNLEEFSYVRSTEDFIRRYPEIPSVQESMVSIPSPTPLNIHHNELANSVPRPPTRPAPALPRQRSSGISERGPSSAYTFGPATAGSSITSAPIPRGLTGLDTTNVTCYINAVLQCLSATTGFREFLIGYRYNMEHLPPKKGLETSVPPQLLTRNLTNVFVSLWCGQYEWITPKTFWGYVNALHAKTQPPMSDRNNAFGGSARQHDAQEFLIFIFDLMTDELNFKRNITPYAQITNTDEQLDARNRLPPIKAALKEWRLFQTTDDSIVSKLFGGLDMTSNTCQNCYYVSKRWTPFQSLNVNFPPSCHGRASEETIGLNALFAHKYLHNELVHGVDCQNCKKKVNFLRSDRLSSVPEYLVVNLVRFENTGPVLEKVRTHVKFTEKNIDITQFWFGDPKTKIPSTIDRGLQRPFLYECYAAVAHRGTSIQSGHYLAFARSLDKTYGGAGSWHCFSDKNVSKSSWRELQKEELTILFLRRQ